MASQDEAAATGTVNIPPMLDRIRLGLYTVRMMAQGEKMVWYAEDENSIFSRISEIPELN